MSDAPYALKIYVYGEGGIYRRTLDNARQLVADRLDVGCDLEVVDLSRSPERAQEDGIIATPTVIRVRPGPVLRVVGDLSDTSAAAAALDL